jgi:hypothetical protein
VIAGARGSSSASRRPVLSEVRTSRHARVYHHRLVKKYLARLAGFAQFGKLVRLNALALRPLVPGRRPSGTRMALPCAIRSSTRRCRSASKRSIAAAAILNIAPASVPLASSSAALYGNRPKTLPVRLVLCRLICRRIAPIGSKFGSNIREVRPGQQFTPLPPN